MSWAFVSLNCPIFSSPSPHLQDPSGVSQTLSGSLSVCISFSSLTLISSSSLQLLNSLESLENCFEKASKVDSV